MTGVFVGVDGCAAGWLAVIVTQEGDHTIAVFPDIAGLWNELHYSSLILIDIPIGLKDFGTQERLCDIQARKLLGKPRGMSVFPVPCREAVYAKTHKEANDVNKKLTERGLSIQAWSIVPQIRETDTLLTTNELARLHIREIHPELCFWVLSGGHAMENYKKDEEGYKERLQVLRAAYPQVDDIIPQAMELCQEKKAAKDDVLDALAAAIVAVKAGKELAAIPLTPEYDSKGLRMEMVIPKSALQFIPQP